MSPPSARIACLDLDTFFVSVERLLDPSLVGRPVIVGGLGGRGVVSAASYEVRPLGVRSGMPMAEAVRRAPHAVVVAPRHGVYGERAAGVRAVLERFAPVVQTASIDEFFLDFRGCERLYARGGEAPDAAIERAVRAMCAAIRAETGLPSSAGIASTRRVAKIASGQAKPAGVRMVPGGTELAFAGDLPVRRFPGIGPAAEARLHEAGIHLLRELLHAPAFPRLSAAVRHALLPEAPDVLGADRPAFREHDAPGEGGTLSNERTFGRDVREPGRIDAQLRALVERVCWRARKRGVQARTVTLKLRYADFHTVTRSRTLPPTAAEDRVLACVRELLAAHWSRRPVRLLGVGLSNLAAPPPQLALPLGPRRPALGVAVDAVRDRFGFDAIRIGATPPAPRPPRDPPGTERDTAARSPADARSPAPPRSPG